MNWKCYNMRKKWLIAQNVSPSQASEQAYWYMQEQEAKKR